MTRGGKTAVVCGIALFLLTAAGYPFLRNRGNDATQEMKDNVPPGTLVGVTYSCGGGMSRDDFRIILSPDAIVEASYWPEQETEEDEIRYDPATKEDVSITAEQWADVEQIVLELYPVMEPRPEPRQPSKLAAWLGARDSTSTSSFRLTWDTEDGLQEIRYSSPNDPRVMTLITLLEELADPIGREIPYYDPPEPKGSEDS